MLDEFIKSIGGMQSHVGFWDGLIAVVVSLIFSLIALLMYHLFYGSRYIGAGVNRTFLIGGPAITALFMGI